MIRNIKKFFIHYHKSEINLNFQKLKFQVILIKFLSKLGKKGKFIIIKLPKEINSYYYNIKIQFAS